MWAAANDGVRRRRRRDKRRRTGGAAGGGNEDDRVDYYAKKKSNGSESDSEEDDSSDGERSTTESVHDDVGPSSGKKFLSLPSHHSARSDRVEDCAPQAAAGDDTAAAFGQQPETRKRKRRKKKKRQIREETPEAAIARLTSSYTSAMVAVGALHRLSGQYCATFRRREEGNAGGVVFDAGAAKAANGEPPSNIGDADAYRTIEATCATGGDDQETDLVTSQRDNEADAADESLREAYTSIQRVARAARSAMEQSLLLDHVIMAPIFLPEKENAVDKTNKGNIKNNARNVNDASGGVVMSSAWLDLWNHSPEEDTSEAHTNLNARSIESAFQTISVTKWNRQSSTHRKEIRKVSYLALVNYADLLLCLCHASVTNRKRDILDRGAVPKLGVVELFSTINGTNRLWSDESTERTVRLALAAYVDASELDPTDPTLWFKLACAARALGWEIQSSSSKVLRIYTGPPRTHRCLERLALERGLLCLPKGIPPNRLVLHAWKEMENWYRGPPVSVEQESDLDKFVGVETLDEILTRKVDQPVELVIHLPRYSWAVLGRILIRASQEGVSYGRSLPGKPRHVWSTVSNS